MKQQAEGLRRVAVAEMKDDWFEYRLERDPTFLARIADARAALRRGEGVRHMPFAIPLLIALATFIGGACATEPAADAGNVDALPAFVLEEELRIGSVDDPDVGFSSINGVDVDRDGNIYVLDLRDRRVRVFDAEGRRIATIGRRGEGPGEFSFPTRLGVVGDTVWIDDSGLHRITLFARDGTVLATVPTSSSIHDSG